MTSLHEDKPATLYRCYDAEGELLYAGCSMAPLQRFTGHRSGSTWWFDVAVVRMEHFASRFVALNAERAAIKDEAPKYNVSIVGPTPLEEWARRQTERARLQQEMKEARLQRDYREVPGLHCQACGWRGRWVPNRLAIAKTRCAQCNEKELAA